jgi:hypothetical protein
MKEANWAASSPVSIRSQRSEVVSALQEIGCYRMAL